MRGGEVKSSPAGSRPATSRAFGLAFTEHPDDAVRERFFQEATSFHRKNAPRTTASTASAPAGEPCASIAPERGVRSDAEPLFSGLSPADRRKLQSALCLTGGDLDGSWGPKTKHALKQYECRAGREPSGTLTTALVDELLKLGPDDAAKRCAAR